MQSAIVPHAVAVIGFKRFVCERWSLASREVDVSRSHFNILWRAFLFHVYGLSFPRPAFVIHPRPTTKVEEESVRQSWTCACLWFRRWCWFVRCPPPAPKFPLLTIIRSSTKTCNISCSATPRSWWTPPLTAGSLPARSWRKYFIAGRPWRSTTSTTKRVATSLWPFTRRPSRSCTAWWSRSHCWSRTVSGAAGRRGSALSSTSARCRLPRSTWRSRCSSRSLARCGWGKPAQPRQ